MIKKLSIEPIDKTNSLRTFTLVLFAFIFCVSVKLIWSYQFSTNADVKWNNEFMITTNDGYYFAEGARDLLNCQKDNTSLGEYYQQNCHQEFDRSPVDEPLSQITYIIAKILPFSFETIVFYLSVFFSSLLVIPFTLLGRRLHIGTAGFIAGLFATLGTSYYSRTIVGYFDTDMLNIFFPMMLIWSLALALKTNEKKYLLFTGLEIVAYRWWYPQSYSIEFAFFGLVLLYVLFFERKSVYHILLLSIMLIGMAGFPDLVRLAGVLIVFSAILNKQIQKKINIFYSILAICIALFFYADGFAPIWAQLKNYVFRDSVQLASGEMGLHFFSVMQTIVESSGERPSFESFTQRMSGGVFLFFAALLGYLWLCLKQPVMLFMLPLLGLGFLSYFSGTRFSMYGVPVLAFGLGFIITKIAEFIYSYIDNKKLATTSSSLFIILSSIFSLYPSLKFIDGYKVGPVFTVSEVALIDSFKSIANREDYVIAWWDYGYPLRYYADVKTLIDGGKHEGSQNFPISFMLTSDQKVAANMARLDVEYTEKRFNVEKNSLNISQQERIPNNNIAWMAKEYGFSDANDFLLSLKTDITLPEKTRDIYFYLPYRMDTILQTIASFSNMDLMNGRVSRNVNFIQSRGFKENDNIIDLNNGLVFDKKTNSITNQRKESYPIKRFIVASHDGISLNKTELISNPAGMVSLIYSVPHQTIYVLNEEIFNSLYVQLFFLENYNPELYEYVSGNGYAKIYKLKI